MHTVLHELQLRTNSDDQYNDGPGHEWTPRLKDSVPKCCVACGQNLLPFDEDFKRAVKRLRFGQTTKEIHR